MLEWLFFKRTQKIDCSTKRQTYGQKRELIGSQGVSSCAGSSRWCRAGPVSQRIAVGHEGVRTGAVVRTQFFSEPQTEWVTCRHNMSSSSSLLSLSGLLSLLCCALSCQGNDTDRWRALSSLSLWPPLAPVLRAAMPGQRHRSMAISTGVRDVRSTGQGMDRWLWERTNSCSPWCSLKGGCKPSNYK
jgi:hypothetical protein